MGQNIGTGGRAWGRILGRCGEYTGVVLIRWTIGTTTFFGAQDFQIFSKTFILSLKLDSVSLCVVMASFKQSVKFTFMIASGAAVFMVLFDPSKDKSEAMFVCSGLCACSKPEPDRCDS